MWRGLPSERRLAALAAVGLFLTLFLPWYQETVIATGLTHLQSVSASLTGWGAFSFVEAAVLLVAAGVLTLLFVRAEGRAFHVPGGDGGVITAAGVWTCALIIWRMFDKEGTIGHGQYATTSGIDWGIFIALGVAVALTYAGTRIRLAHEPEPALPGDPEGAGSPPAATGTSHRRRPRDQRPRQPAAAPSQPAAAPSQPAVRTPDMEADDTWTFQPARGPAAPAATAAPQRSEAEMVVVQAADPPAASSAARRRVRPRSVGAPSPEATAASEPQAPAAKRTERPSPSPALDPQEIRELDIAEPPTVRLGDSPRRRRDSDDPTLS